jgi:putative transcriptional regulator
MLRLKEILKEKGITQVFLAKEMDLSTVTINHWVSGKAMPSVESLIKLAEILEVTLNELVVFKNLSKNENPNNED